MNAVTAGSSSGWVSGEVSRRRVGRDSGLGALTEDLQVETERCSTRSCQRSSDTSADQGRIGDARQSTNHDRGTREPSGRGGGGPARGLGAGVGAARAIRRSPADPRPPPCRRGLRNLLLHGSGVRRPARGGRPRRGRRVRRERVSAPAAATTRCSSSVGPARPPNASTCSPELRSRGTDRRSRSSRHPARRSPSSPTGSSSSTTSTSGRSCRRASPRRRWPCSGRRSART